MKRRGEGRGRRPHPTHATHCYTVLGALPMAGAVAFSPWAYGHVSVQALAVDLQARQAAIKAAGNATNGPPPLSPVQVALLSLYAKPRYAAVSPVSVRVPFAGLVLVRKFSFLSQSIAVKVQEPLV